MNSVKGSLTPCYPGQQLGNYRLIKLLGQGGFADVYLGKHVYLDTPAAVKILHTRHGRIGVDMQAFFDEARIAARLVYPNIVRVLEFGLERQVPFLVMDYAPNGTLRRHYPSGSRLVPKVVLKYVKEVARAVHYIHARGFIHRDIKPENVLLGPHNEVWLSDFGIAIAAHAIADDGPVVRGTTAYMAPEQIEGYPCLESDQYTLGIVVYEWLCGYPPFEGSVNEIIYQHLNVAPPSLCASVPTIPLAVEKVVFKALAKDPGERFESVQAFAAALQDAFEPRSLARWDNDRQRLRPQQPSPTSRQGQGNTPEPELEWASGRCVRGKSRGAKSKTQNAWKETAALYAIDLLTGAALGGVLARLGVAPFLLELLLALCLVLLPIGGAFIRGDTPLFFLTLSITVAAAVAALLSHNLVIFDVTYTGLLLLSLLTSFAVSVNDI